MPADREKRLAARAEYRAAHREELLAASAAYREANREKRLASNRAYRAEHPERVAASSARYRAAHPDKTKANAAAYRAAHPAVRRGYHLKDRYGLTVEAYEAMLQEQGGLCAICRREPRGPWRHFHVDHDHASGVVRGLLCQPCNSGLGSFEDRPDSLRAALRYLEERRI